MKRRVHFGDGSGTGSNSNNEINQKINKLRSLGLPHEAARAFEKKAENQRSLSQLLTELEVLELLSSVHDLSSGGYEHEHPVDGGSNRLDHVFLKENVAYEVKSVTMGIKEMVKICYYIEDLITKHRRKNHHTQIMYGPDGKLINRRRIDGNQTKSITELDYVPVEIAEEIAEKIAHKADEKAKELRKFDGRRIAVIDIRAIYNIPKIVVTRVRRRFNDKRRSLGCLDGILFVINDVSEGEATPGFMPIMHPEGDISEDRYGELRPEKAALSQSIYVPASRQEMNKGTQNIFRYRDGRLIFEDDVVVTNPLVNEWMLMSFIDPSESLEWIEFDKK